MYQVRACTIVFDENTVYGNRSGAHSCLLVTSTDKNNVFTKCKAMRTGVIHGPAMLPRSEMLKVEKTGPGKSFPPDSRLTRVQEMKQAGCQNIGSLIVYECWQCNKLYHTLKFISAVYLISIMFYLFWYVNSLPRVRFLGTHYWLVNPWNKIHPSLTLPAPCWCEHGREMHWIPHGPHSQSQRLG